MMIFICGSITTTDLFPRSFISFNQWVWQELWRILDHPRLLLFTKNQTYLISPGTHVCLIVSWIYLYMTWWHTWSHRSLILCIFPGPSRISTIKELLKTPKLLYYQDLWMYIPDPGIPNFPVTWHTWSFLCFQTLQILETNLILPCSHTL